MYLSTDEQTRTDLGIFGRRSGDGIFDSYNRTSTSGGEALLKEMFTRPLADRDEINRRSNSIAHFSRLNMEFPFDAAQFDMAEKYLAASGHQTKDPARHGQLGE